MNLNIGFVLVPDLLLTGTALPYEMWQAAFDFQRARQQREPGLLHLFQCGDGGPRRALGLTADGPIEASPHLDLIYLPALWRHPLKTVNQCGERLGRWLVKHSEAGAQIAAVSTGVSLLAASGLLNGRAATTHWYAFGTFEKHFPRINLKREFFITQSGNLTCAASINSLADVTVHLIERFFDRATAHHVERNFSHEIRRSFEQYRYLEGGATPLDDELVVEAQMFIQNDLANSATVDELAEHLRVSKRTLERRFRAASGRSVRQYWQWRRMQLAKELLETTNLSIGDIAWRVGYQDAAFFARLFRREMTVLPEEYRRTVRSKLFQSHDEPRVKNPDRSGNR